MINFIHPHYIQYYLWIIIFFSWWKSYISWIHFSTSTPINTIVSAMIVLSKWAELLSWLFNHGLIKSSSLSSFDISDNILELDRLLLYIIRRYLISLIHKNMIIICSHRISLLKLIICEGRSKCSIHEFLLFILNGFLLHSVLLILRWGLRISFHDFFENGSSFDWFQLHLFIHFNLFNFL